MSLLKIRIFYVLAGSMLVLLGFVLGQQLPTQINNHVNVLPNIFETPQTTADQLPSELSGQTDWETSSTRLLAKRTDSEYWAAHTEAGQVCILIVKGDTSAAGCTSIEHFRKYGVFVELKSPGDRSLAILFPDGYQQSIQNHLPTADITDNLIILDRKTVASLPDSSLVIFPDALETTATEPLVLIFPKLLE